MYSQEVHSKDSMTCIKVEHVMGKKVALMLYQSGMSAAHMDHQLLSQWARLLKLFCNLLKDFLCAVTLGSDSCPLGTPMKT